MNRDTRERLLSREGPGQTSWWIGLNVTPHIHTHPRFGQVGTIEKVFPPMGSSGTRIYVSLDDGETLLDEPADEWCVHMIDCPNIKAKRTKLGLSLADAAIAAGWTKTGRGRWGDIETGRRANVTVQTLADMAIALGCEARDLLR